MRQLERYTRVGWQPSQGYMPLPRVLNRLLIIVIISLMRQLSKGNCDNE